ncbi:MAG: F0F1 ATP synthase subunit B [Bacteroidales bacterium]|nr:F0F1 ATP synthase subunit B [Bacteroidales bacterium]
MSLITPDFGLLFWMTLIFGIVFFLLAKFGFPVITDMVHKRQERIDRSIADAREIEVRLSTLETRQAQMLEEARREQAAILKEAAEAKNRLVADAKQQAREEADKILADARTQIAAEKESALRDIRKEVALLGVDVAEKILRKELDDPAKQEELVQRLVDEAGRTRMQS